MNNLKQSPLELYFPKKESSFPINSHYPFNNSNQTQINQNCEILPYQPISVSSEMVGTSIHELISHNFPTKNSWENSRLGRFPEEIIIKLNYRSHIDNIIIKSKINRPIPLIEIYISNGIGCSYSDSNYNRVATACNITDEGTTIKTNAIGNYIKIVFIRGNLRTYNNPYGQVSLSELKLFGQRITYLSSFNDWGKGNDSSFPLNDLDAFLKSQNYDIAPIDEETKYTLKDLIEKYNKAKLSNDNEFISKIKEDIEQAFIIGNEILNTERLLQAAVDIEDFESCVQLRNKRDILKSKRDYLDVKYETLRYENMIQLHGKSMKEVIAEEEYRKKREEEKLLHEKSERERKEREAKMKEEEENKRKKEQLKQSINKLDEIPVKNIGMQRRRVDEYIPQKKIEKKEEGISNELQYNQGDRDLEPYFVPRAKDAGGLIPPPDINKLRRALRQGILTVFGVRLFSSLIGDDWKMREAAVNAFLEYIQNPIPQRYIGKTFPLFRACIELCKYTTNDKVIPIYTQGLKILQICLTQPICGNDVEPTYIQKSIKYFLPMYIKKLAEFNDKQRDLTLKTLIDIFRHPALNVGELVKACLDIVENNYSVTPDKQPWNVLLPRLEIILHVLDEYGLDEGLWDWYNVFIELIIPSLFHQKPDCRIVAEEICIILYKFVGNDIRNIINGMENIKQNLKEKLNKRMNQTDSLTLKEENAKQKDANENEENKENKGYKERKEIKEKKENKGNKKGKKKK